MSEEIEKPIDVAEASDNMKNKIVATEKTPRTLLEILVYGVEGDRKRIKKMLDAMQEQMAKARKGKFVRVLWYVDKGELNDEAKKQWLIEKSNAKYIVFAPEGKYSVPGDYVRELLFKIKALEDSLTRVKNAGLIMTKPKTEDAALASFETEVATRELTDDEKKWKEENEQNNAKTTV